MPDHPDVALKWFFTMVGIVAAVGLICWAIVQIMTGGTA